MTLRGIRSGPGEHIVPIIDSSDQVGVSVEALKVLGLVKDKEMLTESLTRDYQRLIEGQDRSGELFVKIPLRRDLGLAAMLNLVDSRFYEGRRPTSKVRVYPRAEVWPELWEQPVKDTSVTDVNNLVSPAQKAHARLALKDGPNPDDPFLYFVGQPYDDETAVMGEKTQLGSLAGAQVAYEQYKPDFNLTHLSIADYVMLDTQARIRGEALQIYGQMNIPFMGRKRIHGESVIGSVSKFSHTGGLQLGWTEGRSDDNAGIGLSVGISEWYHTEQ
jgi:hypothetical protein